MACKCIEPESKPMPWSELRDRLAEAMRVVGCRELDALLADIDAATETDCDECKVWVTAIYEFIDAVGPRRGMSIPEEFEHAMLDLAKLVAIRHAVLELGRCSLDSSLHPGRRTLALNNMFEWANELARQEANRGTAQNP